MVARGEVEAFIDSVEILNTKRVVLKKLLPLKSCVTSCEHDLCSKANRHFSIITKDHQKEQESP